MNLFIPACGDRLTLITPWSFRLFLEHRNLDFAKTKGLVDPAKTGFMAHWDRDSGYPSVPLTLDAGTVLECDRLYVRSTSKSRVQVRDDYDSITWRVIGPKGKPVPRSRFWTKLHDTRSIEFAGVETYRDRVKLAKLVMES